MDNALQDVMREATRLTQAGRLNEATEVIQRGLSGVHAAGPLHTSPTQGASAATLRRPASLRASARVIDDRLLDMHVQSLVTTAPALAVEPLHGARADSFPARLRTPRVDYPATDDGGGEFSSGTHTHGSLTRRYKLYSPPDHFRGQLALVVMLHGCTQDPDDFATGTAMNERAGDQGFFVLYPEQSQDANPSRCWNWFKHNHQRRDRGEPALIASLTLSVMKAHGIDPQRVFIAGLSAGGAMAAVVAAAYPDIFAAVGVHSGLPPGAARNLPEGLAAMRGDAARPGMQGGHLIRVGAVPGRDVQAARTPVPTIVFHGDQDRTVHPHNGEQVIEAMLGGAPSATGRRGTASARASRVEHGVSRNGRHYTRMVHLGEDGHTVAEHWLIHGAGHAWGGGRADGSYTDARGPDATAEMLRFFFSHPRDMGT